MSFPEGLDVEVMSMDSLSKSSLNSTSDFEKEHVTQYIHQNENKFKIFNIKNDNDLSSYRWTIDTEEDYLFAKRVYRSSFLTLTKFSLTEEIYELLNKTPSLLKINNTVKKSDLYK